MSLQIEHIPSVYYNSSATIGSLFLFNDYMNEPNIRSNKLYIECKSHVKKMFPHVDENDMGIHVAIIGMMALKEGPFYNSNKMHGGSKGGVLFLIAHTSQFLLLLYFLILMWSAYMNLETHLISKNLEIVTNTTGVVTFKKVTIVDLYKNPKGVAIALAANLKHDAAEKVIDFTIKATKQAHELADKYIKDVGNDLTATIPQQDENTNLLDTLVTLGQWAGLVQNSHDGLLVENAMDIVITRSEFATDEFLDNIYTELKKQIRDFKNDAKISSNQIKYNIKTYARLFKNNAIQAVRLLLTMSGTVGIQKLMNHNSANVLKNSGGKKKKKTHKKRKKKTQRRTKISRK